MNDAMPVLDRLTPQMRAILDRQSALAAGKPARAADDYAGMRQDYIDERAYWNEGGPAMHSTVDAVIDTEGGPTPVRFYRPRADAVLPVIVFIHGGGWMVGSLDTHDRMARIIASLTGSAVVAVDYSLSPEAKFPTPLTQCAGVVRHVRDHAAQLGLDGADIALAGDSSGAYFSLATALYLRDHEPKARKPRCLLLMYGVFGLRDSVARRLLGGPWDGMALADLESYWNCYVATPDDLRDPYVDVLSGNLEGLPPCYIAAADLDPAKDDSYVLDALLTRQGVNHTLTTFTGVLHAFAHYTRALDEANTVLGEAADFYRDHKKQPKTES